PQWPLALVVSPADLAEVRHPQPADLHLLIIDPAHWRRARPLRLLRRANGSPSGVSLMPEPRRVLILGGGHAGVRCARELIKNRRPADKLDITMVSREHVEL